MYCSHCGANLPQGVTFCFTCGNPVSGQNNEPESSANTQTSTSARSSYDLYIAQLSTDTGSRWNPGETQAPPPPLQHRRFSPGFLKGFFSGFFLIILLGG